MSVQEQAEARFRKGDELAWLVRPRKPLSALKEYREALRLDPCMAKAHWRIGQVNFHMVPSRLETAESEFREAIRLDPLWSHGYAGLAHTLCATGRKEEALEAIQEAVRLNPTHSTHTANLGVALLEAGRYAEAIEHLLAAIDAKPMNEIALRLFLAEAYEDSGQLAKAIEQWVIMVREGPTWDYEAYSVRVAKRKLKEHSLQSVVRE
jgi:tetratricopeptide (TPR) repeat protein